MSKAVKIKIYKAIVMVKPVVRYGSETWAMTEMGKHKVHWRGKYQGYVDHRYSKEYGK